ncbi:MAG: N-acetylglutamate synthase or related acetyltransferase, GNAT family [Chloroflexi bacterium AL-W]|nr:N-acetylglutamate synthase or related acetyltransferase, GNAT family [Chloroflexi bacterium AL-N1]NOK67150.1 N-acetylglutamate synthase or related acetyltransferase, GNAT family [Chloroflexi bacterium AL-N10]NOK74557.1 N-acetylglutamate synthase or related acetyltransferase, GNAT family [Chloroflexi bacterium AL-N5]NOK81752.1 N-acetylglutamate synthase or related acetyltransferase, GNAT family [Chloroflexi bacterium AL-W]NOK89222.1 N-acetylglutamate synthase or related acetyltransferase, GNA
MTIHVFESHIQPVSRTKSVTSVRPATEMDVRGIATIVAENARQGHLLPRTVESIRESIATWVIAEVDGTIAGCGSLLEMSPTLVEVRSLAVLPAYQNYGTGGKIVRELVTQARQRGFKTVFALTRAVPFFERQGFQVTGKERFQEKVWRDCAICPLQQCCDETAVVIDF